MVPLGTSLPPFSLQDVVGGKTVSDSDSKAARGLLVMFICTHCPFVKHIRQGLSDFAHDYQKKGLAVVAIASNDIAAYPQDGPDGMREEARAAAYTFPYLFDESQEVAQAFQAACTPDFFLYDGARRLVYRGQFDASRPSNQVPVTGEDLRRAADDVLAGRSPSADQTPSVGCNIKWKAGRAAS
jgi:thiol-disulfide isomerase/thioredoxin